MAAVDSHIISCKGAMPDLVPKPEVPAMVFFMKERYESIPRPLCPRYYESHQLKPLSERFPDATIPEAKTAGCYVVERANNVRVEFIGECPYK